MEDQVIRQDAANTINHAGGTAYEISAKHGLSQLLVTSCLNGTFYCSSKEQVDSILTLAQQCNDPLFVAKIAVYAHRIAYMRESPAALCAWLAANHADILENIFPQVIDSGEMLRKFCNHIRLGKFGRKSFGTKIKRLINNWFDKQAGQFIFRGSIGNNPSMGDVIRMTHPKPQDEEKSALFAYLLDHKIENGVIKTTRQEKPVSHLPAIVQEYESWKLDRSKALPRVSIELLMAEPLTAAQWIELASKANWKTTLKNLNTFQRHCVYQNSEVVATIAERLQNEQLIKDAKVLPYQLLSACLATESSDLPKSIKASLSRAMEIATRSTPQFEGKVYICVDVSGSMVQCQVTGNQSDSSHNSRRPSSSVRCVDAAAMLAACIVRRNPTAEVICFASEIKPQLTLDCESSIFDITQKIVKNVAGGTNCSLPIAKLNQEKKQADVLIFLSDYESWFDVSNSGHHRYSDPTKMMTEWLKFKESNRHAKLICVDLSPGGTSQVKERTDVLQVGGMSDRIFGVMDRFLSHGWSNHHWVEEINSVIV